MAYLITFFGGVIAGAAGMFLVYRKNQKLIGAVTTAIQTPPK